MSWLAEYFCTEMVIAQEKLWENCQRWIAADRKKGEKKSLEIIFSDTEHERLQ